MLAHDVLATAAISCTFRQAVCLLYTFLVEENTEYILKAFYIHENTILVLLQ